MIMNNKPNATDPNFLDLPFVEFGKIFRPGGNATDFEILDRSNTKIAEELYGFYNQKIAVYSVVNKLEFTERKLDDKPYGNYTVALLADPRGGVGSYIFAQIQQRRESEYLLKQNLPVGQFANNRPYNHARFTAVTEEQIRRYDSIYTSLLVRLSENGNPSLKDYYSQAKNPKDVVQVASQPIDYQPDNMDDLDETLLKGLVNLLHECFGPKYRAGLLEGKSFPAVTLVVPDLDVKTRLRLMQAAQALLMPATRVITFTLDFISEHLFQFYFCANDPPSWMFTNPMRLTKADLHDKSNDINGYYQSVSASAGSQILNNPVFGKYLNKLGITHTDGMRIATLLTSKAEPMPDDFSDLFLRNLPYIGKDDVPELVKRAFEKPLTMEKIILDAPSAIDQIAEESQRKRMTKNALRLALYLVICQQTREMADRNLPLFFHYYRLIEATDRATPELQEEFRKAVINSLSTSLNNENYPDEKNEFFYELLSLYLSKIDQVVFKDQVSVPNALFSRPQMALYQAINKLQGQTKRMDELEKQLISCIVDQPEIWTSDEQNSLKKIAGLKLSGIFIQRIIHFLNTKEQSGNFQQKLPEERCRFLLELLKDKPEPKKSILDMLPKDKAIELREVCRCVFNSVNSQTLDFAGFWLLELSLTGERVFEEDYIAIVKKIADTNQVKSILEKQEYKAICALLVGAVPSGYSLSTVCQSIGLENRYRLILLIWIHENFVVPSTDIEKLVEQLPDTHAKSLLVQLIIKATVNSHGQTEEIKKLDERISQNWLQQTASSEERSAYFDTSKVDQLYDLLSNIEKPTQLFALYMLAEDPSSQPSKNISWKKHAETIGSLYQRFAERGAGGGQAELFVEMVKCFDCPHGKEYLHHFGLYCLARRSIGENKVDAPIDDNKELRLLLTYALGSKIDEKIAQPARDILLEQRDHFLQRLFILKNDEVWTLHLFSERNGVEKKILDALEAKGWEQLGRKSHVELGGEFSPSNLVPSDQDKLLQAEVKIQETLTAIPVPVVSDTTSHFQDQENLDPQNSYKGQSGFLGFFRKFSSRQKTIIIILIIVLIIIVIIGFFMMGSQLPNFFDFFLRPQGVRFQVGRH